jgi:hypothetical protein
MHCANFSKDIADPNRALALYPDYEKPVLDVYIDTIQYLLEHPEPPRNGRLGFLTVGQNIAEMNRLKFDRLKFECFGDL